MRLLSKKLKQVRVRHLSVFVRIVPGQRSYDFQGMRGMQGLEVEWMEGRAIGDASREERSRELERVGPRPLKGQ